MSGWGGDNVHIQEREENNLVAVFQTVFEENSEVSPLSSVLECSNKYQRGATAGSISIYELKRRPPWFMHSRNTSL